MNRPEIKLKEKVDGKKYTIHQFTLIPRYDGEPLEYMIGLVIFGPANTLIRPVKHMKITNWIMI